MSTLYIRDGEAYREAAGQEVLDRAQAVIAQRFRAGAPCLENPARTAEYLKLKLGALEYEVFGILALDARNRLIEYVELFRGTIDGAAVYPREVAREALARNAASLILFHCHPSGNPSASAADEALTRRIVAGLALLDIRVLDHFIVGETITSFAQLGLL
jgi:DNA repair protein RadC